MAFMAIIRCVGLLFYILLGVQVSIGDLQQAEATGACYTVGGASVPRAKG